MTGRASGGSIIAAVDDEPTTYRELFTYIALLEGGPPPAAGGAADFPSFRISNVKARETLGWRHATAPIGQDSRECRPSRPSVGQADIVLGECCLGRLGAREKFELGALDMPGRNRCLPGMVEQPGQSPGEPLGPTDTGERGRNSR